MSKEKKEIKAHKRKYRLSNRDLATAWTEIQNRRAIAFKNAEIAAKLLSEKCNTSVSIVIEEHDMSYIPTYILAIGPSWPNSKKHEAFTSTMPKFQFPFKNKSNREIKDCFYFVPEGANKNQGYYCYVKEPQAISASNVGC